MWGPSIVEPEKKHLPSDSPWKSLRGKGQGEQARAVQPGTGRGLWRGDSRPL